MKPFQNSNASIIEPALSSEAAVWVWCAAEEITQLLVEPCQRGAAKDQLPAEEAAMLAELLYELASQLSDTKDDAVSRRALSMALLLWDQWEDRHHGLPGHGHVFLSEGADHASELGKSGQPLGSAGSQEQRPHEDTHVGHALVPYFTEPR